MLQIYINKKLKMKGALLKKRLT